MNELIKNSLQECLNVTNKMASLDGAVELVAEKIVQRLTDGGKILILGNGGSAADAMHIAGEYVNKLSKIRKGLPALALSSDTAVITAIGNDSDFSQIFSRQLEALATPKDLVIVLSTSGESKNIIAALEYCRVNNIRTVSFTANTINTVARLADYSIKIPSQSTPRIQEAYMLLNHIICTVVEQSFTK